MTQIKFTDRANIGSVKRTQEGYIITRARALRTGIQEYHSSELGLIGDRIVKVMRPEASIKDANSLTSIAHVPITIGHPDVMVTSENWKDYAVGEVSTKAQWDGEFIALDIMLKDKAAIDAVDSGTVELSAGYVAAMDAAPAGSEYDFIMGPPMYNHLAIVDKARAGSQARIGDTAHNWGAAPINDDAKETQVVDMKAIIVGDKAVQVTAEVADAITKMVADHKTAMDAVKAELAAVKIECADATKQIKTAEDIAKLVSDGVKELTEVSDKARKLVKDYDATGKDAMEIRREVIAKVYGDEAAADLTSDAEITAAFKVANSQAVADPVRDAIKDKKPEKKGNWDFIKKEDK